MWLQFLTLSSPVVTKVHTYLNLQLKFAGLFECVRYFGTAWRENGSKRSKDTDTYTFLFSEVFLNTKKFY